MKNIYSYSKNNMKFFNKYYIFILILFLIVFLFFYFDIEKYFNFQSLKQNNEWLLAWKNEHYFFTVTFFMLTYIAMVLFSIPFATFLTLIGGFLFGIFWGTLYVIISATLGAFFFFIFIRLFLEKINIKKINSSLKEMQLGFRSHEFEYLLILRLLPIFPFWLVNLGAAILSVRVKTFTIATFFGIIPATFIYTTLGSGLHQMFQQNKTPNLNIIFSPHIFFPLLGLVLLLCLSIIYKTTNKK